MLATKTFRRALKMFLFNPSAKLKTFTPQQPFQFTYPSFLFVYALTFYSLCSSYQSQQLHLLLNFTQGSHAVYCNFNILYLSHIMKKKRYKEPLGRGFCQFYFIFKNLNKLSLEIIRFQKLFTVSLFLKNPLTFIYKRYCIDVKRGTKSQLNLFVTFPKLKNLNEAQHIFEVLLISHFSLNILMNQFLIKRKACGESI